MSRLTVLLLLAFSPSTARAEAHCPIPQHGSIAFTAPAGWAVTCGNTSESPASGNLQILPAKGDAFKLLVTSIWVPPAQRGNVDPPKLKATVQSMLDRVLPGAVETAVNLVELSGSSARGWLFSVTDKAPKPGEYKYMMQGSLVVGELLVTTTFLYRDAASADKAAVMALLKGAHQAK